MFSSVEDDYVDNMFDDSSGGESDQGQFISRALIPLIIFCNLFKISSLHALPRIELFSFAQRIQTQIFHVQQRRALVLRNMWFQKNMPHWVVLIERVVTATRRCGTRNV